MYKTQFITKKLSKIYTKYLFKISLHEQVHKINNDIDYIVSSSSMPIVLNKHCSEHSLRQ